MKNKSMKKYTIYFLTIFVVFQSCSTINHLKNSKSKLAIPEHDKMAEFHFEEKLGELGHNSQPWETTNYRGKGDLWLQKSAFLKQDTLVNSRNKKYTSKTDYRNGVLLYLDYGDKELLTITKTIFNDKLINTARYSPAILLDFFLENKTNVKTEKSQYHIINSMKIGDNLTKIFINKENYLVDKITNLSSDELYGDTTTTFNYSSYTTNENLTYPKTIAIEKINGKVIDSVSIDLVQYTSEIKELLNKPENYQILEDKNEEIPVVKITKYNNFIHFLDLEHTDDRVMVVEFEDYMLVAEAPLNTKNGELIINEAKKIAPHKPIKYFVFGHHHPHYLGGLRAFVHKGATILCTNISKEYVEYIANASHTIKPDSLQMQPKKIKTQIITDSLSLGKNEKMKIYFIGEKSAHTKDYLIYYFPNEKLLFQDDSCMISNDGTLIKAGNRQKGLYESIVALGLDVETIVQSWPITDKSVKNIFSFKELEESIVVKK